MKRLGGLAVAVCALALTTSSAHARPVGTLTCTSSSSGQVKFNVSYFNFGVQNTLNIGSQSSGAGAGKITFQPLEVHASLSAFSSLLAPASNGSVFQTCMLNTSLSDGSQAEFEFKLVAIASLNAVASMPAQTNEPARYTDVNFQYGAIEVRSTGSSDDGGTGAVTGGWNQVTNQNQ
ncbi:MAG TPA: hypothetical protein VHZ28_12410 [Terracidiphilus sp.]|jgi:hypothetical protein|nr:hypothetical protein [Terracidiphilus sp.]